MKIARFNDDRIGVVRNDTDVVDVSDAIDYRVEKGPQRVIEEVIEKFATFRKDFERKMAQESGVPVSSVRLLAPIPRPSKCLAAFANYLDRPDRPSIAFQTNTFIRRRSSLARKAPLNCWTFPRW